MQIGYFGRPFNYEHKSLSTRTHIVNNGKVLCNYKPHKTMEFQWCVSGEDLLERLNYVECNKCKERYLSLTKKKLKNVLKTEGITLEGTGLHLT